MEKTLVNAYAFRHTGELKMEGTLTRIRNMEKASFLCRRKPVMETDFLGLINTEKPIYLTPNILYWKTSTQEKAFTCGDSGKTFHDQSYFKAQMTTHDGEESP